MATMSLDPSSYQHLALINQLTPPPSPGNRPAQLVEHAANIGKLRRSKTPEPLMLTDSNYTTLNRTVAKAIPNDHDKIQDVENDAAGVPRILTKSASSGGDISPLSPDYQTNGKDDVTRPISSIPIANDVETPSDLTHMTHPYTIPPTIMRSRKLPISTFSAANPTRSNTVTSSLSNGPALPRSKTIKASTTNRYDDFLMMTTSPPQGSTSSSLARRLPVFEKELPPPPPPSMAPVVETIPAPVLPKIDPNNFPIPETLQKQTMPIRPLRTAQSIGVLIGSRPSGPKTGDSARTEFLPGTLGSKRPFRKRLFSGAPLLGGSSNKSSYSATSGDSIRSGHARRLSKISSRKDSNTLEDPLAPVMTLPQHTNHEDVAGGLTYLPRYTNSFAGFCKSAWRLQLADPKSFDIKNRSSTNQTPTLKCSKCNFEGPLHPQTRPDGRVIWTRIPDSKIYSSFGVSYTWQFLFKCHLALKKDTKAMKAMPHGQNLGGTNVDMSDGLFGCILCCALGNGTPVFRGPEALSWHLRSHADYEVKDQELQHRFKVIIGRDYDTGERFDVHIPQVSNTIDSMASVSVSVSGDGQWEDPSKVSQENATRDQFGVSISSQEPLQMVKEIQSEDRIEQLRSTS